MEDKHNMEWNEREEKYLNSLCVSCKELAGRFKLVYRQYHGYQTRFRIPSICISSVLGLISFGSGQFGSGNENTVSIVVGVGGVILSIMGGIEAYLAIGQTMSAALLASNQLQKLCESISLELALPVNERSANGIMFLRQAYNQYEKILDNAPSVLKKMRYVLLGNEAITPFSATPATSVAEPCEVVLINA
jgi:hypothetical protein